MTPTDRTHTTTIDATARPLTADERSIIREAARYLANSVQSDEARLAVLAARWRATLPDLPPYEGPGHRLVQTYVAMYPALEAEGGIDSWGGSESKSVLARLVCLFPPDDSERLTAVRAALEVCQWSMGRQSEGR